MSNVTYSPEDNKIRLYVGRVPRDEYEELRAAGFVSTPKQDCDFVATWTPSREDLASQYLDDGEDIGDEDYSPLERSADRAERFEGYREKRTDEATAGAERFDAGPAAFGHQSRARAERQAKRHDRNRTYAVSQWSKAEYWQSRTEGVIAHALYRSSASVRRGRILTLEAEQRKNNEAREQYAARFSAWSKVSTMEGADKPIVINGPDREQTPNPTPAGRLAYVLANSSGCWGEYQHPRIERKNSLYSLLTDHVDSITPAEAAALWLDGRNEPGNPASSVERWAVHLELRLGYERAMLANEGGSASEAEMEPGGWIQAGKRTGSVFTDVKGGWMQIHAVNKSPATGRIVSVKVMGTRGYRDPKPGLVSINIERLPEDSYRAPTDEERAAFTKDKADRKAKEKASKPKEPSLINPNDADAERLQAIWNAAAKERHDKAKAEHRIYGDYKPTGVRRMTQAEYSARSKGSYGSCEIRTLHACGRLARRFTGMYSESGAKYDKSLAEVVAKVRMTYGGTGCTTSADAVIVLADKPQKPLPLDWEAIETLTPEGLKMLNAVKQKAEAEVPCDAEHGLLFV